MSKDSPTSIGRETVVRQSSDQVSAQLQDEVALLSIKVGSYFHLNAVGARIWQMLEQPTRVGDICDTLVQEYDVERERLEEDIARLASELVDKDLAVIVE